MVLFLGCLAAFLLGAVPFGLVLVRVLTGKDLRKLGSGNVGATNASRAFADRRVGLLVFLSIYLLDAAKGFVPASLAPGWIGMSGSLWAAATLGLAAVLGHCFSPFLGFRGGKGVATATGVFAALDIRALAVGIAAFFVVLLLSRQVFLGSLSLGVALAVAAIAWEPRDAFAHRLPLTLLCLFVAAFLFWTHRENIRKFLARSSPEVSS